MKDFDTVDLIYAIGEMINNYHGEERAVSSRVIETSMGCDGRFVRNAVNYLRQEGYPICSGSNGYFWAKDITEVNRTIANLQSRIDKIQIAINGLKGVTLQ